MQGLSADRVSFVSSGTAEADAAMARLRARYGDRGLADAEVIVALGGDGLMMRSANVYPDIPLLGINFGKVGFLALVEQQAWRPAVVAKHSTARSAMVKG